MKLPSSQEMDDGPRDRVSILNRVPKLASSPRPPVFESRWPLGFFELKVSQRYLLAKQRRRSYCFNTRHQSGTHRVSSLEESRFLDGACTRQGRGHDFDQLSLPGYSFRDATPLITETRDFQLRRKLKNDSARIDNCRPFLKYMNSSSRLVGTARDPSCGVKNQTRRSRSR